MSIPITFTFAASLGALLVAFAFPVVVQRAKRGQPFGDGGEGALLRAIRAHGNFTEYAPLLLVLVALLELGGASETWLLVIAGVFLLSRALYALYFYVRTSLPLRIAAFWATVLPIAGASTLLATL